VTNQFGGRSSRTRADASASTPLGDRCSAKGPRRLLAMARELRRRGRTSAPWPDGAGGRRLLYGGDRAVADELTTESMNSAGD